MNTQLLDRILEDARRAATPVEAMKIADIQTDLAPFLRLLETSSDVDEPMGVVAYVTDFKALSLHVAAQPFEVAEDEDDDGDVLLTPLTPGAFHEWLEELERLAQ